MLQFWTIFFNSNIVSKENITLFEMVIFDSHDEVRMKGGILTTPFFFLLIDRFNVPIFIFINAKLMD